MGMSWNRGGGGGAGAALSLATLRPVLRQGGIIIPGADGQFPALAANGSDDGSVALGHGQTLHTDLDVHPEHGASGGFGAIAVDTQIQQYFGGIGDLVWQGVHDRGAQVPNPEEDDCYATPNGHFFAYIQGLGAGGLVGWWPINRPDDWIIGGPFASEAGALAHASGNGELTIIGGQLRVSSNYVAPAAGYTRRSLEVIDPSPRPPTAYYYGDGADQLTPPDFPYTTNAINDRLRMRWASDGPHRTLNGWTFGDVLVPVADISADIDVGGAPPLNTSRIVLLLPAGRWNMYSQMREAASETSARYELKEIVPGADDISLRAAVTYGTVSGGVGAGAEAILNLTDADFDGNTQVYFELIGTSSANITAYLKLEKTR